MLAGNFKFTHLPLPPPKQTWNRISENGRRFYVSSFGKKYPSITEILSINNEGWLDEWRKNVGVDHASQISRVSSQTGTQIHKACENYLNNISPFTPSDEIKMFLPQIQARFKKMIPALDRIDFIYAQELLMGSTIIEAAGTVDCIAEFDGVLSIIDFKTSRKIKTRDEIINYFIQKTAYAIMFYEMYGIKANQLVTIISVEGVDKPSVFITPVNAHYEELKDVLFRYYERKSNE